MTHSPPDDTDRTRVLLVSALLVPVAAVVILFAVRMPGTPPPAAAPVTPGAPQGGVPSAEQPMAPVSDSYRQRVEALEARLADAPDDTMVLAEFSALMESAHQAERALELATRWTELAPESTDAWMKVVALLGAQRRWDEAYEANQKFLEIEPDNPVSYMNMGAIQANRGNVEEARTWWSRVVEEAPGTPLAQQAAEALASLAEGGG